MTQIVKWEDIDFCEYLPSDEELIVIANASGLIDDEPTEDQKIIMDIYAEIINN